MKKRRGDLATQRDFMVVSIPDYHTPAHDPKYIDALCRWLSKRWIDSLNQLGDAIDHESIGRFAKESPKKLADGTLLEEWEIALRVRRRLVESAREVNSDCSDYWLEGNHEFRSRRLEDAMPMLFGFFDREYVDKIKADGGQWVPNDSEGHVLRFEQRRDAGVVACIRKPTEIAEAMYCGHTSTHGWSYAIHSAKNNADRAPWPGVTAAGHTHAVQVHTLNQWGLMKRVAINCGWGGLPYPGYIHGRPNQWEQAFEWTRLSLERPGAYNYGIVRVFDGEIVGEMEAD